MWGTQFKTIVMTFILLFSLKVMSAEYFVSSSGSDTNSGSSTSPFKTIQKGVSIAKAGDIITVRPGVYAAATMNVSGSSSAPITLRAQYPAISNPEASRSRIVGGGSGKGLSVNGAYWIIDGFEITKFGTGIGLESNANRPVVRQNVIHNNSGQGVQCWKCNYSLIEKNHFLDPGPPYPDLGNAVMDYGVNFYVSTGNKVLNNYFFGKFNHDISIKYLVRDTLIAYNTFEGCMLQCIELGQTPDIAEEGGDKTSHNAIVEYNIFRDAVDAKTGAFYRHHNSININNIVNVIIRSNFFENNTGYPIKTLYSDFAGSQHIGVEPSGAKIYGNTIVNQRTKDPYSGAGTAAYAIRINVRQTSSEDLIEIYNNTVNGVRNFSYRESGTKVISHNNLANDPSQLVGPLSVFDPYANRGPRPVLQPNWAPVQAYRLIAGSRHIDAGTNVGLPYSGTAPDLGSNEFIAKLTSSPAPAPAPASCVFNGKTIASGSSVTAFRASSVPYGSTCASESRLCTNGVLSGSFAYASCSVEAPKPPLISSAPLVSNVTTSSVTIKWSLSEPSTGQIEYGPTTAYGSLSTLESRLLSSHTQVLSGLSAGTVYHFRVISKNAAGAQVVSSDLSFKTQDPPPPPLPTGSVEIAVVGDPAVGSYSVQAKTTFTVDISVQFFDNGTLVKTEHSAPYCLTPELSSQCTASKLGAGTHNLMAVVLAADGKTVLAKASRSIVEAAPAPTPAPSASCNYNVSTLAQLKSSLSLAKSGQVICVSDSAVIDVTSEATLTIPGGVTLRSGRSSAIPASGASLGGKIKSMATTARPPLMQTGGDGVKIIGLRFEGPVKDPKAAEGKTLIANGQTNTFHGKYASRGISIRHGRTLIENTELYGFGHYAISVSAGVENIVRNSFMHHNQLYGLGYGVMTSGASSTLITNNIFDYNRHAIASTGATGNKYEASYNVSYRHHIDLKSNHEFDVHGQGDSAGQHSGGVAGAFFSIHHNTFYVTTNKAFLLRGIPSEGVRIFSNRVVQSTFSAAFAGTGGGEVAIAENMAYHTGNVFSISQPASFPVYSRTVYPDVP